MGVFIRGENGLMLFGDSLDFLKKMKANKIDTVITDPPYALKFMGKDWDKVLPRIEYWEEMLRVCKPGATLMAFGGTRTFHRLACLIEDAGWKITDCIQFSKAGREEEISFFESLTCEQQQAFLKLHYPAQVVSWVYGSGFPKSHNISKGIDKAKGAKREVVGPPTRHDGKMYDSAKGWNQNSMLDDGGHQTAPATDLARQWEGWGTALKPAWEPIVVAIKPVEGTFAKNALKYGVAGMWIDGGRIETNNKLGGGATKAETVCSNNHEVWDRPWKHNDVARERHAKSVQENVKIAEQKGRWPANLIHDGSEEVLGLFPESKGQQGDVRGTEKSRTGGEGTNCFGKFGRVSSPKRIEIEKSAARFFYCAKASKSERNKGCEELYWRHEKKEIFPITKEEWDQLPEKNRSQGNIHPTVKPLLLMEYLCRLTRTPTGGIILDPFAGSGTTAIAAENTGRKWVLMEQDENNCLIAKSRIKYHKEIKDF